MDEDPRGPPVGFVRLRFLPTTETFIYTSLRAIRDHRVRVFTLAREHAVKFPWSDVVQPSPVEAAAFRATTVSPTLLRWARTVRILHAHHGQTGAHCVWAARHARVPLVTSFYGLDTTVLARRDPRALADPRFWHYRALARTLFTVGSRFVVLSRHMSARLTSQGCPADKVRIVRLGVDLARFAPAEPRPEQRGVLRVLMVGREVEKKGFDDGLVACARARALGVRIQVDILGTNGPNRAALARQGRALGLEVSWLPPGTPAPRAMMAADVLLAPSRTASDGDQEGTPTVICEAGASELPVVSTRHAGIPEQVDDGVTGLLTEERDVEGMAAHLLFLATEPTQRRRLGTAARAKMEREYSVTAHVRDLQAVYREILTGESAL